MKSQFYLGFRRSNLISCERVATGARNRNFTSCFWRSNLVSCEKVAPDLLKIRNFTSVFGDRTSFRAKGLRPDALQITILPQFWRISCERAATGREKSQFYLSFWRSNLVSCERVRRTFCKSQFYLSFWRSNLVSCERVAFRAVSLALPRACKREIEKKERARGQESKRARDQEGKRPRGQEEM